MPMKTKPVFDQLNEFFDQIYVISLRRSSDRHEYLEEALDGLNYRIFWGLDGKKLSLDELYEKGLYHPYHSRLLKKRAGRTTEQSSTSIIGCALSHLYVCKNLLEEGHKNALILEDDIIFRQGMEAELSCSLKQLPKNWELFYLGHTGANSNPTLSRRVKKNLLQIAAPIFQKYKKLKMIDPEVISRWFPRPYSEHLNRAGSHFGTHAYAVSASGAQKIIHYQTPVVQEADNVLGELCSYGWLHAFSMKNQLVHQNTRFKSLLGTNLSPKEP